MKCDEFLNKIALHHLIRVSGQCENTSKICQYDKKFKEAIKEDNVDEIKLHEIEEYQELVLHAAKELLRSYDIVLSTCSLSGEGRIRSAGPYGQVIIDECGMCMEPEAMIPIVYHNADKVVLIGDHQQLRPIVMEPQAKELGLEKSLFERYALMHPDSVNMLTSQYRMVRY